MFIFREDPKPHMNNPAAILAFALVLGFCGFSQASGQLSWSNIDSVYNNFDSVQPHIINDSDKPVYFIRTRPFLGASVLRLNEKTREWETGSSLACCATVSNPDDVLDLGPNEGTRVNPDQAYIVTGPNRLMFMLQDSLTLRPLAGRYKLRLLFALEPWTVVHTPGEVYSTDSPEFIVVNK